MDRFITKPLENCFLNIWRGKFTMYLYYIIGIKLINFVPTNSYCSRYCGQCINKLFFAYLVIILWCNGDSMLYLFKSMTVDFKYRCLILRTLKSSFNVLAWYIGSFFKATRINEFWVVYSRDRTSSKAPP